MTGFAIYPVQPVHEETTIVGYMTNGNDIYVVRRDFADGTKHYEVQLEVSDFCVRPVGGVHATFDEAVVEAAQYQYVCV